jgi:hypothetical protein
MKKVTQEQQVVEVLRKAGGYATLRRLNELVDFSTWATKTPEASVRRIVQNSPEIFKIQPGLWALEEMRDAVLHKFELKLGNKKSEELFSHAYYQGLLVEIGKFRHQMTYVPAQDQNRLFVDKRLGEITDTTELPAFTYKDLCRKAKDGDFFVTDWLRNRNTIEFLGVWERVYNPNFNYGEFATIRNVGNKQYLCRR